MSIRTTRWKWVAPLSLVRSIATAARGSAVASSAVKIATTGKLFVLRIGVLRGAF